MADVPALQYLKAGVLHVREGGQAGHEAKMIHLSTNTAVTSFVCRLNLPDSRVFHLLLAVNRHHGPVR